MSEISKSNWIFVPSISAIATLIWLNYNKPKFKKKTEVIFYEPIGQKCSCYFLFDAQCQVAGSSCSKTMKIINYLRMAEKSLDICVFTISNEPIAAEIIKAHNRGVLVRIIVSNGILLQTKEVRAFLNLGINLLYQKDPNKNSFMHNKFCIVDSKWLIHGSMNWTHQATFKNWESIFITNIPSLITQFSEGFEKTLKTI